MNSTGSLTRGPPRPASEPGMSLWYCLPFEDAGAIPGSVGQLIDQALHDRVTIPWARALAVILRSSSGSRSAMSRPMSMTFSTGKFTSAANRVQWPSGCGSTWQPRVNERFHSGECHRAVTNTLSRYGSPWLTRIRPIRIRVKKPGASFLIPPMQHFSQSTDNFGIRHRYICSLPRIRSQVI